MAQLSELVAREILDSKSDPVVEVSLSLDGGPIFSDSTPSGASTGDAEAYELRDGNKDWYSGKGVSRAVENVNKVIKSELSKKTFSSQSEFDQFLIQLDGTPNKSRLGANSLLPISMAFSRALAYQQNKPLYEFLRIDKLSLPIPLVLLIEGGKHGDWATDIQEFMVMPQINSFPNFKETFHATVKIFKKLGQILDDKHYSTGVGFEGAYCPHEIKSNEEALELICKSINQSGYSYPEQFVIAVDFAASEFFTDNRYVLHSGANQIYDNQSWLEKILYWTKNYPLYSLEDPFDQQQWEDWTNINSQLSSNHQIVGDDLVVTNVGLIQKAIDKSSCNAVIIKPNQIGTISETISAIQLAKSAGFKTIVSHRGGETCDSYISDLAVATASNQCKFGGPDRGERIAKYNRLLTIEAEIS